MELRRAVLDSLLRSRAWRAWAATMPGDREGETLLASVARRRAALCRGGGAEGARRRLRTKGFFSRGTG